MQHVRDGLQLFERVGGHFGGCDGLQPAGNGTLVRTKKAETLSRLLMHFYPHDLEYLKLFVSCFVLRPC